MTVQVLEISFNDPWQTDSSRPRAFNIYSSSFFKPASLDDIIILINIMHESVIPIVFLIFFVVLKQTFTILKEEISILKMLFESSKVVLCII